MSDDDAIKKTQVHLTDAVGAGVLPVTLGPQLVALVACSADSPPNWAGRSGGSATGSIGVLPVLWLTPGPGNVWAVDANLLLELLKGIMRAGRKSVYS